jgi:RNA polymerase sigma-70 factor (ECF subfamily)
MRPSTRPHGSSARIPTIAGDADSNDAYVRSIRPFVESTARRFASNPADAEDIAQDTLITLVCGRTQFDGRTSPLAWAYAVVRSQASHRFRRTRPLPISAVIGTVAERCDPHDAAAGWDARYDVEHALALLDPIDRAIVIKREVEGCDSDCVARSVGLSVPAVKSRLHRARHTMRARLDG